MLPGETAWGAGALSYPLRVRSRQLVGAEAWCRWEATAVLEQPRPPRVPDLFGPHTAHVAEPAATLPARRGGGAPSADGDRALAGGHGPRCSCGRGARAGHGRRRRGGAHLSPTAPGRAGTRSTTRWWPAPRFPWRTAGRSGGERVDCATGAPAGGWRAWHRRPPLYRAASCGPPAEPPLRSPRPGRTPGDPGDQRGNLTVGRHRQDAADGLDRAIAAPPGDGGAAAPHRQPRLCGRSSRRGPASSPRGSGPCGLRRRWRGDEPVLWRAGFPASPGGGGVGPPGRCSGARAAGADDPESLDGGFQHRRTGARSGNLGD